jgi:eukaryotic-like serine/threonine-protein kinase
VAANHVELGEKVALKFLQPEMMLNPEVVARFSQEALAAVKIKSEHVARVFDVGALPDGTPFIVIEHLQGKNLEEILRAEGTLPIKRAVEYVMQACEALADAHACGIVHRDVKPENLFLIQRSQGMDVIKVLDFGVSKVALTGTAFDNRVPLVRTMLPVGSPVYMSPEQIRASKDVDPRTDIWSLGCVLYELLSGRPAFDAPSVTELAATILEQDPEPVRSFRADVPPELEAIIARCLNKNPAQRYQNIAELALALYPFGPRRARLYAERCCMVLHVGEGTYSEFELPSMSDAFFRRRSERPAPVPEPIITTTAVAEPSGGKKWWFLVGAVVVAAAVGWAIWQRSRPPRSAIAGPERLPPVPSVALPERPAKPAAAVTTAPALTAEPEPSTTPPAPTPTRAVAPLPGRQLVPIPPKPKEAPAKKTPSTSSDPDPGF